MKYGGHQLYKLFSDKTISYMKRKVNMTEIVKYVYVIIIFLSLFLVATNIEGKPFYRFQIFFFTSYTIFYRIFCYIILIFFFITGTYFRCFKDSDCIKKLFCRPPLKPKCMYKTMCKCKAEFTSNDYVLTWLCIITIPKRVHKHLEYSISCHFVIGLAPQ